MRFTRVATLLGTDSTAPAPAAVDQKTAPAPSPTDGSTPGAPPAPTRLGPVGVSVAIVSVVLVEIVVWFLVRSQGIDITGDSPSYLIMARALGHLTINPLPAYASDMASHAIYHWPPGVTVATTGAAHVYLSGLHGP